MNDENEDQSQSDPGEYHPTNGSQVVRKQFHGDELSHQLETAATAIAAAEKAAIESRYILAMRRPRDWDTVLAKLLKECQRPGFADAAIYRKPVGKKQNPDTGVWEQNYVEGLSVRFAEAAIRHITNFYSSAKSIYDDSAKSIVRITVMDLESNATIETDVAITKTTERKSLRKNQKPLGMRTNSFGEDVYLVPATDDEILNKTNAQISKALRNGVLRLLPGDIQDACEELCRATQAARDKADPDAAKRKLFDAFAAMGIYPDALKAYLRTTAEVLLPAELAELRAIYSAIRDGETTWVSVMEAKYPPTNGGPGNGAKGEAGSVATEAAKKTTDIIDKTKARIAATAAAAAAKKAEKNGEKEATASKDESASTKTADPAAGSDGLPEPAANG